MILNIILPTNFKLRNKLAESNQQEKEIIKKFELIKKNERN